MKHVTQECDSCNGTGLYSGFAEPKGTAVICISCGGKGWYNHGYKEFTGRKMLRGVKSISDSAGRFIPSGVGLAGKPMSYDQFLRKVKS